MLILKSRNFQTSSAPILIFLTVNNIIVTKQLLILAFIVVGDIIQHWKFQRPTCSRTLPPRGKKEGKSREGKCFVFAFFFRGWYGYTYARKVSEHFRQRVKEHLLKKEARRKMLVLCARVFTRVLGFRGAFIAVVSKIWHVTLPSLRHRLSASIYRTTH